MSSEEISERPPSARRGSLFLRTAGYSALVTLLTLTVFGFRFVAHERESLYAGLRERADSLALVLDSVAAQALEERDYSRVASQALRVVHADEDVLYVVFTPSEGPSFVQTERASERRELGSSWRPQRSQALEGIRYSDLVEQEVFHLVRSVATADSEPGWLHVGVSTARYANGVRNLLINVLGLAVPGLLIGVLTSFIFANRLTRPIAQLKRFAQRVASGDLQTKVEVESRTELGLLGDTMNQMVSELRKSREAEKESTAKEVRLREQEILLKEIHHRVKNNLQILSSLLRMQARRSGNEEMKGMLRESEARIRSMGLIHEKLYQSRSLSSVNFGSYVETLASQLVRMHAVGDQPPELEVNIDDIDLPLDTAMPCGLIINELVSNSLKYAFVDRQEGRIAIDVHREGEGEYRLRVSDNGVGMKLPQKGERRSSLGLNLIEMLVDQLNGSLEYKNGNGITADIRFHEVVYQSRV